MTNNTVPLKIAYIGGGSRGWAQDLMNDLALEKDLTGNIYLYDIDFPAAKLNEQLGNWLQTQPGVIGKWKYRAVEQIDEALKGADFVFISIQPGSLEMMEHEITVAEKYGLFFPVGDTTGVPGLMRGLRSAIIYEGFAHQIAQYCPQAWVINYTNPMTICTRTLTKVEPTLKVFGCCHEVFGTQHILAELAQKYFQLADRPQRNDIRINVFGINHFTWIDKAMFDGHDMLAVVRQHIDQPGVVRPFTPAEVKAQNNWFFDARQIKFELFQRYGVLAAAGDRHLSEFMPGFVHSPEELFRWGVIRTPMSYRFGRWDAAPGQAKEFLSGKRLWKLEPSGEEAIRQLRALVGLGDLVTNINVENIGQITNLPLGVVVETNAYFSRDHVQPLTSGAIPRGVNAMISRHIANQEMIIDAALNRNEELAFQAVFNDPTTYLPIDRAWKMYKEIGMPDGFW